MWWSLGVIHYSVQWRWKQCVKIEILQSCGHITGLSITFQIPPDPAAKPLSWELLNFGFEKGCKPCISGIPKAALANIWDHETFQSRLTALLTIVWFSTDPEMKISLLFYSLIPRLTVHWHLYLNSSSSTKAILISLSTNLTSMHFWLLNPIPESYPELLIESSPTWNVNMVFIFILYFWTVVNSRGGDYCIHFQVLLKC